jgi:hypothetical protein
MITLIHPIAPFEHQEDIQYEIEHDAGDTQRDDYQSCEIPPNRSR